MKRWPERRKVLGLWFCWICRKPLRVIHGQCPDSTEFRLNGIWRDCHDDCYLHLKCGDLHRSGWKAEIPAGVGGPGCPCGK